MNTVIHVPHASIEIPAGIRNQFLLADRDLYREAIESADLYTDTLAKQAWPEATVVCSEISRLVVDVERYPDDNEELMSKYGRGMIYMSTHLGLPLRRTISENEKYELKRDWYDPHWARLRAAAEGGTLIDLHSYPAVPWIIEANPSAARPEIDLGTDRHLTPRSWVKKLKSHFEALGFTVGQDMPYAGVIDAGSKYAVMIEIRRDILCSPKEGPKWQRIVDALSSMPMPNAQL